MAFRHVALWPYVVEEQNTQGRKGKRVGGRLGEGSKVLGTYSTHTICRKWKSPHPPVLSFMHAAALVLR